MVLSNLAASVARRQGVRGRPPRDARRGPSGTMARMIDSAPVMGRIAVFRDRRA